MGFRRLRAVGAAVAVAACATLLTAPSALAGAASSATVATVVAGSPAGTAVGSTAPAGRAAAAAVTPAGGFVALPPTRLADTRYGTGTAKAKIPAGGTLVLPVAGSAGVPATGAAAIAANVNVLNATAAGRLTVYAAGTARPNVSTVAFSAGAPSMSLAVSALSAAGAVAVWNSSAKPVDIVVDVSGYFAGGTAPAAGGFVGVPPSRSLDTRSGVGATRSDWQDVVDGMYSALSWQVSGRNAVPVGATAVVMTLTATNVESTGQFVPFDDDPSFTPGIDPALVHSDSNYMPVTGTSFTAGAPVANVYLVPLSAAGRAALDIGYDGTTTAPGTDLIGDVVGYLRGGGAQSVGTYQPLPVGHLVSTVVPGRATVDVQLPVPGGSAASMAVTTADSAAAGGVVLFQQGTTRPATRTVNFAAGQRVSNTAIVSTSAAAKVSISNLSATPVSVTIDLLGYFRATAGAVGGTVWSSGDNSAGGMGLGFTSVGSNVPAPVALTGVRKVASSAGSSYAVTADGSLWSWGRNNDPEVPFEDGQLGLGTTVDQSLPVKVAGLTDVVDIDADYPRAYALQGDGTVWQWGGEEVGEVTSPAKVGNLTDVVSLDHGNAVKANGTVWSVSYTGTFDDGCPPAGCFLAKPVSGLTGIAQVSGQLALRTDGVLEYWAPGIAPVVISNITGVQTLAGDAVLRTDGTVWIAPTDGSRSAVAVPSLTGVTTLGELAVKADGSVWRFSAAGASRVNLPPAAQVAPAANLVVTR